MAGHANGAVNRGKLSLHAAAGKQGSSRASWRKVVGGRRHWTVHGRTYARAGLELTDDEGAASYKGTGQPGFVQEQQVGRVGRGILSREGAGADGVGGRQ